MLEFLNTQVPPFLKVMWKRYGLRSLVTSGLRLCVVIVGGALVGCVAVWTGQSGPTLLSAAVALAASFALKGFDLVGRTFICQAIVHENMSETHAARRAYRVALFLVYKRAEALCGLVMTTSTSVRMRYLRRLAKLTRGTTDREIARFVGTALEESADIDEALDYFSTVRHLTDVGVALAEARLLLKKNLPQESLWRLSGFDVEPQEAEVHNARSKALTALGRNEDALAEMEKAIKLRSHHAKYHYEQAMILERMGRDVEALESLNRSIFLHDKNPEALYKKGVLCARLGKLRSARRSLRRSLFYNNMNTGAFIKLETLRGRSQSFLYNGKSPDEGISLSLSQSRAKALVGETIETTIIISSARSLERCFLSAVEPYGGGLEVLNRTVHIGRLVARVPFITAIQVVAKRPSTVNLGSAWRLNFVFTCSDAWASIDMVLDVIDPRPGQIFLLLSEDHEAGARGRKPLTAGDVQLDLVQKARIAHLIARDYGMKWTHLIDAGTALGMVRWAATQSSSWSTLHHELLSFYEESYTNGHDLQLHLHLSAEPDSSFFCYRYDPGTDTLVFDLRKKNSNLPSPQISSWANVVSRYGTIRDPDSRVGSIAHARSSIVRMLSGHFPAFTPILFRAGQWDFGKNLAEREKSVLALLENGVLADSSATLGGPLYTEHFGFGSPPEESCYFTKEADINERARTLTECGLTEILPLFLPQGVHPVTPRVNPRVVVRAYKKFVSGGSVRPGRHVLMEIEHISTISDEAILREQLIDTQITLPSDIVAMRRHFRVLNLKCPKLRSAGAREVLETWWDYYSPQLIGLAMHTHERSNASGGGSRMVFPLRFLGTAAVNRRTTRIPVFIPLPMISSRDEVRITIMRGKALVWASPKHRKNFIKTDLALAAPMMGDLRLEIEIRQRANNSAGGSVEE